jgi:hypothetical protein
VFCSRVQFISLYGNLELNWFWLRLHISSVPVACTCDLSYLGGWDWEDHDLRPAWANCSRDPTPPQSPK